MSEHEPNLISSENQSNPIAKFFSWFFGGFFLLGGLGMIVGPQKESLATALCFMMMGVVLLPPFNNLMLKHFSIKLSRSAKAAYIFLGFVGVAFLSPRSSTNGNPTTQINAQPVQEQRVELIKDSCLSVAKLFDSSSSLSSLQKDELWKQKYRGKFFEWPLEVVNVSAGVFSGFTVQFKCNGSNSLIQDIQLSYPSNAKGLVIQFQKGSVYKIKGKLVMQNSLLGLSGDATTRGLASE